MDNKDLPSFDDPTQEESPVRLLNSSNVATETIDLNSMFPREVTTSGSFDLSDVRSTAFGKLLNSLPMPALLINASHSISFVNESCQRIGGKDSLKIIGAPFRSLFPLHHEATRMQERLERIFSDRRPAVTQGVIQVSGKRIWGRLYARSIRLGTQRSVLLLIEDLTAEKRELILNEKYRRLVDAVPEGIAEFSIVSPLPLDAAAKDLAATLSQAALAYSNTEFLRMHGFSALAEVRRETPDKFMPLDEDVRQLLEVWSRNRFKIAVGETKQVFADGTTRYIENTIVGVLRNSLLTGLWLLRRDLTERRLREEALAESEKRFRMLYDSSPIMKHSIDCKGIVRNINQQWLQEMGYSRDEVLGRRIDAFMTPESAQKAFQTVLPAFWREGAVRNVTYQYVRRDGSIIDVLLDSIAVRDPRWGLISLSTVRNFTDRKKAEDEAARVRSLLRSIVENLPTPVFLKDAAHFRYVLWNKASEDLFGYTAEEVTGKTVDEFFPPDQAATFGVQDQEALQTGKLVDIPEEVVSTRYKGQRIVHSKKLPIVDENEVPHHLLGISEDVTERKLAEHALIKAREAAAAEANKLRTMIEGMDAGIVVADADDVITEVNSWFLERVGLSKHDMVGKSLWEFHPDSEVADRLVSFFQESRAGERPRRAVTSLELAGMKVSLRVQPIFKEGQYEGAILNVTDVTDLVEARIAAEAASKAKSDFLASMSHEIRTPMHGILGMTELALHTKLTGEQREYLETVRMSGEALLQLINDILDFSKIEAGKFSLDEAEFDLQDTLGSAMQTVSAQAQQKGLEMTFRIAQGVPDVVVGDAGRLRQVVINLLGNAIKFTQTGEVVMEVNKESESSHDVELHFCIADTGVGIPEGRLEEIFSPFTQVDSGMSRKFGGTGLGLAITSKLVAMMNGRAWAESQVGHGSRFHFTARFRVKQKLDEPLAVGAEVELQGLRVLVVDDNPTNRRIMEEMLRGFGMGAMGVDSGKAGLWALVEARDSDSPFSLVIVDSEMPEMDGFMFAEEIHQFIDLPKTTVMMLSSSGESCDVQRCKRVGISAYLWKPIKEWELLRAIKTTMALKREGRGEETLVTSQILNESAPRLKVLLAEDNLVNQKLAARMLERRGHYVTVVPNGKAALEALDREKFDLILMDLEMPEMNGLEATRAIREKERQTGGHIPIIAMTAHAMKNHMERCLQAGMDGYLSKPMRGEELYEKIERVTAGVERRDPTLVVAEDFMQTVDREALMERLGGDGSLLKEIVDLFVQDCSRLLADMKEAVGQRDAERLEMAAHSLKGSVGNFGAPQAVATLAEVEALARRWDLFAASEALKKAEQELQRVKEGLAELVQEA